MHKVMSSPLAGAEMIGGDNVIRCLAG